MSMMRWAAALTKTLTEPPVPAGTTAALARSWLPSKLSVETVGCVAPAGQTVRKAFW